MAEEVLTFNTLLVEHVQQQMNDIEAGKSLDTILEKPARQELLDKLKDVTEEPNTPKLFDRTSLKQISSFFDNAEKLYSSLQDENHPARFIYPDSLEWFRQSYKYMYDSVSFLEVVRFFAGGKTQDEKEISFRALISKLIKTQDTVRTITQNKEFVERYLENHTNLKEQFPEFLAKKYKLQEPIPPNKSVLVSIKRFVDDTSRSCLNLLSELDIEIPDSAQKALQSKQYYDALILAIRHSPTDLFAELGSDDYSILVEEVTKVNKQSQLHPNIYLFQHIKRAYLTDWLVHTLRQVDRDGGEEFYQAGKAEVYSKYEPLSIPEDTLDQLKQREHLDNKETIDAELDCLNKLSEDELYALLLKMYTSYKNDDLMGKNMPLAPQTLSSAGDISWDKQNMVAQASKKVKELETTGGGAGTAKAKRFASMFTALKKATKVFTVASSKVAEKKKQAIVTTVRSGSEENTEPPPPPPIEIKHSGELISVCFPLPKRDCLNPVPGQKQDLSFNNSDSNSGVSPLEQEFIVNMFNIDNEPNLPKINNNYTKLSNTISTIMKAYGDDGAQRIQKKYTSGVNVSSFTEEMVYLKLKEDVILVLGVTEMGQSKNIGTLPKKQTAYFRLFVKGSLSKGLTKYGVPSILKEFRIDEKSYQFKEVSMPVHFKEAPKYQGVVIDSFATIIEGLPEEDYELLNNDEMIGFISILQEKARKLIDDQGVQMGRATSEDSPAI